MKPTIDELYDIAVEAKREVAERGFTHEIEIIISAIWASLKLDELAPEFVRQDNQPSASPLDEFPISFVEWAEDYDISNHRNKFLVAAGYLFENENIKEFTTSEIMDLYDQARWSRPQNPADVVGKAANGKLYTEVLNQEADSDNQRKTWRFTRTGFQRFQDLKNRGD